jgi:hypothetical protein
MRARLSPRRLAAISVARPHFVLAVWGVVALMGFVLIGGLVASALSSESDVTSNPESKQAQDLTDARFAERDALDELVIVRSDELTMTAPPSVSGCGAWLRGWRRATASRRSPATLTPAARCWSPRISDVGLLRPQLRLLATARTAWPPIGDDRGRSRPSPPRSSRPRTSPARRSPWSALR